MARLTGTVSHWDDRAGFGLISCHDCITSDALLHARDLRHLDILPRLGMRLSYEMERGASGPIATNLQVMK
jgi:cold shock CspA family protein